MNNERKGIYYGGVLGRKLYLEDGRLWIGDESHGRPATEEEMEGISANLEEKGLPLEGGQPKKGEKKDLKGK